MQSINLTMSPNGIGNKQKCHSTLQPVGIPPHLIPMSTVPKRRNGSRRSLIHMTVTIGVMSMITMNMEATMSRKRRQNQNPRDSGSEANQRVRCPETPTPPVKIHTNHQSIPDYTETWVGRPAVNTSSSMAAAARPIPNLNLPVCGG